MTNPMESREQLNQSLEQETLDILNANEIGSLEAKGALNRYVDECHREADAEAQSNPESEIVSNRANIKAEIKIGALLIKSEKYRAVGIESLEQTLMATGHDDTTADLAEQIN
ncbi:MAG: hypothetical protein WCP15_01750, partial [bacterium]